jgi:hypothetical protein
MLHVIGVKNGGWSRENSVLFYHFLTQKKFRIKPVINFMCVKVIVDTVNCQFYTVEGRVKFQGDSCRSCAG